MMTFSNKGLAFLKKAEHCVLTAYKDPLSKTGLPITIGYGSTMNTNGTRIKLGDRITQAQAEELLAWEVSKKSMILNFCELKVTQAQFDAIVLLTYNIGVGAFKDSTLRKMIKKNPEDPAIEAEWLKWHFAGGIPSRGLMNRRKGEYKIYSKSEYS
ncbi:COG3772 Phage-related lysozyme (muraminidase) [uncultured Caudovirales phage]|uniref:Lysozyme n=1 Tax=uncultured Caudovirales phage TaxID=2100421 RepID=A0A6J5LRB2_9CAUD|nr:COG3772 Phage-related lysozyme (muraminidase) [uncultured Caudovirales phage]CAB4168753.1 COG3772 Phage-related lysozyme (muraminidase) [uncultured Caudovirales phage]